MAAAPVTAFEPVAMLAQAASAAEAAQEAAQLVEELAGSEPEAQAEQVRVAVQLGLVAQAVMAVQVLRARLAGPASR